MPLLPPKEALTLKVKASFPQEMLPVVAKLAGLSGAEVVEDFGDTAMGVALLVRTAELFVPLTGLVNADEEIAKLEAELAHKKGFLEGVRRKLSNEQFVAHAPEAVVAVERKKEADALSAIESIENQLKA